jgi:phosphoribosylanthranilate isomerase
MTRVKICGITSTQDAAAAMAAGADALGFVFVLDTPRYIRAEAAERIVAGLPPFLTTVGVFVNQALDEVLEIAARCRLQAVQLHGEEPEEIARRIPVRVIKAIRVRNRESLRPVTTYPADAFLLDAYVEGKPGGTGSAFPWDLVAGITERAPIILSGGLRPDNVEAAIRRVRPYAVDVSSGVEVRPGEKDPQRVREFVAAVRRADID